MVVIESAVRAANPATDSITVQPATVVVVEPVTNDDHEHLGLSAPVLADVVNITNWW